jgi:hypothetical protein
MQDGFQLTLPDSTTRDLQNRFSLLEGCPSNQICVPEHALSRGDPANLPERVQLARQGRWKFGVRLGFSEIPERENAHRVFSAAEILDSVTMEQPSGFGRVSTVDLVRAVWSVLSTHIVPDVARALRTSISDNTRTAGTPFELDLVITTDFSEEFVGGLQLTIQH